MTRKAPSGDSSEDEPISFPKEGKKETETEVEDHKDYELHIAGRYQEEEDEEHQDQLWNKFADLIDQSEGNYYGVFHREEDQEIDDNTVETSFDPTKLHENREYPARNPTNRESGSGDEVRIPVGMTPEMQNEFEKIEREIAKVDQKHDRLAHSIRDDLVKPMSKGLTLMLTAVTLFLLVDQSWTALPTAILSILFFAGGWVVE